MTKPMDQIKWTEILPGAIAPEIGSAREYKTGSWRSSRPVVKPNECIKCGVCWLFCPDMAIVQAPEGYFTADLNYCKGCGICTRECPVGCITMIQEQED